MKVIVNSQSSEVKEINANAPEARSPRSCQLSVFLLRITLATFSGLVRKINAIYGTSKKSR